MTKKWHPISSDLIDQVRAWGFEAKTEKCGELAGRPFYQSFVFCTDDENDGIYDTLTLNCE